MSRLPDRIAKEEEEDVSFVPTSVSQLDIIYIQYSGEVATQL